MNASPAAFKREPLHLGMPVPVNN
ncbi:hypothetical protein NSMM_420003 [Nitrosomonas mobilis]|uniref:Uncharacterized protein n=1 Tax=Nitrosomonas mobilis TaxID=51642 RepID=A0A1G5SF98_9PROT|nr:hypothetical protein NSMM_420003 [Nitrosomonas mobilis]